MVFASICEHASSAFIFASTNSDKFSHVSSEHFRNYKWRAASTSKIFRQLESLFIKMLIVFKTGPCYLGLNSGQSVSINVSKTRKHFSKSQNFCAKLLYKISLIILAKKEFWCSYMYGCPPILFLISDCGIFSQIPLSHVMYIFNWRGECKTMLSDNFVPVFFFSSKVPESLHVVFN